MASIGQLPDEVLSSVLEFLCVLPKGTDPYRPVCRKWHRVGRYVDRSMEENEWRTLETNFHRTHSARCHLRELLVAEPSQLARIDHQLSDILSRTLSRTPRLISELAAAVEDIRRLLDAGAAASELNNHELMGPNLGDLVDNVYEVLANFVRHDNNVLSIARQLHALLIDLICSPCTSWRYNKRYAGNGGCRLPWFAMKFCFFGGAWGYDFQGAGLEDRWMGWKVFRLMMLAARTSGDLHELLCEISLVSENNFEYILRSPTTKFMFRRLLSFLCYEMGITLHYLRESIFRIHHSEEDGWNRDGVSGCTDSFFMFLLVCDYTGDSDYGFGGNESCREPWESILKAFWGNKFMQNFLYSTVRTNRTFRTGLLEHGTRALCRRKDRRMFELLVQMEPCALINTRLDDIIDTLETTRGKKERILSYMKAFKASAQQKELVLAELSIAGLIHK